MAWRVYTIMGYEIHRRDLPNSKTWNMRWKHYEWIIPKMQPHAKLYTIAQAKKYIINRLQKHGDKLNMDINMNNTLHRNLVRAHGLQVAKELLDNPPTFGVMLLKDLTSIDMSVVQAADLAKVSKYTVYKWLEGYAYPHIESLLSLCAAFEDPEQKYLVYSKMITVERT